MPAETRHKAQGVPKKKGKGGAQTGPLRDPLAAKQLRDNLADPLQKPYPPGFNPVAKATELHEAFDGWGTDERKVLDILYTGRADLTKAIQRAYDKKYSPKLAAEIRDELSGDELNKALKLLAAGGLTLADKLREAAQGWGTDEAKIFHAFDRASPQELATVAKDKKIRALLMEELSGEDWLLAKAYLAGKGQLIAKLRRAVDGWGTDEEAIWDALRAATPDEKAEVLRQPALMNHLKGDLSGDHWMKCERMLKGTFDNVDRIEIAMRGWGTEEAALHKALEELTAAEFARLPADIDARLDSELGGSDLAKATETLHQKRLAFDAAYRKTYVEKQAAAMGEDALRHEGASVLLAGEGQKQSVVGRLRAACAGAGTNEKNIWSVLASLKPAERDFIRTNNPEGILDVLRKDLNRSDMRRVMKMLGDSRTAAREAVKEAISGWGTDDQLLFDAIERAVREGAGPELVKDDEVMDAIRGDVSRAQYQIVVAAFRSGVFKPLDKLRFATDRAGTDEDVVFDLCKKHGTLWFDGTKIHPTVDRILKSELDTRDYWKAIDAIRGEPRSEEDRLARAKELLERERSSGLSNAIMDSFSDKGENADDAWREYQASFNVAHEDGQITEEEQDRLRRDEAFSQQMTKEYREAKAKVAAWATQIAVAIVGIAATILTAGAAGPFVAAIAASLGGKVAVAAEAMVLAAALKVGLNKAIQGEGYDVTSMDTLLDAASASIEVGLNMVGGAVATRAMAGLGKTAVAQSVSNGVNRVFGQAGQRILAAGLEGTIDGAIGGLGEGTFLTLANEDTWKKDANEIWGDLGRNVTQTTLMSAVGGGFAGVALKSVGEVFGPALKGKVGDVVDVADDLGGEIGRHADSFGDDIGKQFDEVGEGVTRGADGAGDDVGRQLDEISPEQKLRRQQMKLIGQQLDTAQSEAVAEELKSLIHEVIGESTGPMKGAQFNELMDRLEAFGNKYGVQMTQTIETVGVYPKGLDEIQLAGFGKMKDLDALVGFAKRHELAHIVHTLQCRATLKEAVNAGKLTADQASAFLKSIEGGSNYLQFEKAVTGTSSAAHWSKSARDLQRYGVRLDQLVDFTAVGMHAGRVQFLTFPNGLNLVDAYAAFLSKAPMILGTSAKELAFRMPLLMFASYYSANVDITWMFDPTKLGIDRMPDGSLGARDFFNSVLTDSFGPGEQD